MYAYNGFTYMTCGINYSSFIFSTLHVYLYIFIYSVWGKCSNLQDNFLINYRLRKNDLLLHRLNKEISKILVIAFIVDFIDFWFFNNSKFKMDLFLLKTKSFYKEFFYIDLQFFINEKYI